MIARREERSADCVVVDLNTQRDFCMTTGAYPVLNVEALVPAIRRVLAWIKRNHAPVISSVDCHRMWELGHAGEPIHCVDGSSGQKKLDFTILPTRTRVEADNTLSVPFNLFKYYQQVIFPKRTDDLLSNPKADRFLTQLPMRDYVVFGNGLEESVKAVVLGLIARGKCVNIVVDACGYWNRALADLALRQMSAKGAALITVGELLERKLSRRHRYPMSSTRSASNGSAKKNGHQNGRTNGHGKNGATSAGLPALDFNAILDSMEEADDGFADVSRPGDSE
jgi:nicotinamidase-related amidase